MKTFRNFCLSIACLLNAVSFAGGSTGGGNVVICNDATTGKETIRLLDYYEGELLYDLVPELGKGTELEMVTTVINRLAKLDKSRAARYLKAANNFSVNTRYVSKVTLPDIGDHAYVPLEESCRIAQIAVQNISPFPGSKKFTIRKDYWSKLSAQDRAGLMLHEIIYEEALGMGHTNSKSSRYFNSLISSVDFASITQGEYEDRLKVVGFKKDRQTKPATGCKWVGTSLSLPKAESGSNYRYDLANLIRDITGSTCTFKGLAVPSWLTVSSSGVLSGTPGTSDVGDVAVGVEISDGKITERNGLILEVDSSDPALKKINSVQQLEITSGSYLDYSAYFSSMLAKGGAKWLISFRPSFLSTPNSGWDDKGVFFLSSEADPSSTDQGMHVMKMEVTSGNETETVWFILNVLGSNY